ncbi:PREDICTED: probable WRKY transcription factor 2 [Tarenaya hassleriana]|uniref:probable WRKY transcription factor 2 n=1 Tax=Tarenaya hassleriana TaxID=28532 RepID=UPI00053C3F72|nr:PREDICTED: probable WRKY transcription factor 2 [Tarenaya hassleriana]
MSGFDDHVAVMGEWIPRSPSPRTLFTAMLEEGKSSISKPVLERELSLNHGQITFEEEDAAAEKKDSLQTGCFQLSEEAANSRGCLSERLAARAGFNAPKLNTENIPSPCLTISSPGLSPATLLESPVFLSNPLAQPSPTTGKRSFFPGGNSKDEFFDDIGASSFTFQPVSRSSSSSFVPGTVNKVSPISDHSFPDISTDYCNRPQTMEGVKPGSRTIETVDFRGNFPGTSAERHDTDPRETTREATDAGDDSEDKEPRGNGGGGDMVAGGGAPADDGFNWRKYGQKLVKGSEYPRSYYKCTHPNCQVKKKVERSREGHITEIIYKGSHNHPKPPPSRRSAFGSSCPVLDIQTDGTGQDSVWTGAQPHAVGTDEIAEEGSPEGNQSGSGDAATATATMVDASSTFSNDEDEDDCGTHGSVSLGYEVGEGDETESKRRKLDVYAAEMSGATRAIREPRVVVQTTSDVDILDDGYRWRKYGQKVVKGNPNPRSYYKCTAPGCTVRKHVERASHDLKSVITTYEGKHNHEVPAARNSSHGGSGTGPPGSTAAAQTHMRQPESRNRFESPVTVTSNGPFGRPFSFQPPPGFSFGLGQTGLHNLGMPGLAFGQGKLPGFPVHPYLTPQPQVVGDPGMMLPRGTEPKVEPLSEPGVALSEGSSIYRQIMSRLPHI